MEFFPSLTLSAARHGSSGAGGVLLIIIVLLVIFGYWISLRLHPHNRCRGCRRTPGRHWGSIYRYSYRPCRSCGGTARKNRLGVRIMTTRDRQ